MRVTVGLAVAPALAADPMLATTMAPPKQAVAIPARLSRRRCRPRRRRARRMNRTAAPNSAMPK